jgi:cytidylate kinase
MTSTQPLSIVIAIDGPSGVGKSTVARRLAQKLGYHYVDSGAMYRAVGWIVHKAAIALEAEADIVTLVRRTSIDMRFCQGGADIWIEGCCVTAQLRAEAVGAAASAVATLPAVRQIITARLRQIGDSGNVVMEGRDIGTVVFPDATVKFFLDAALEVRGQRRFSELQGEAQPLTMAHVVAAVAARDAQDRSRETAPLVAAADAYVIDTTDLSIDDVVQRMLSEIDRKHIQREGLT